MKIMRESPFFVQALITSNLYHDLLDQFFFGLLGHILPFRKIFFQLLCDDSFDIFFVHKASVLLFVFSDSNLQLNRGFCNQ